MFPLEQGAFEMLLIGAIALIVVGPKDLPVVMRKVGQFTAKLRGMAAEFRASFDEMARQSELDELRREVEALRSGSYLNPGVPEAAPVLPAPAPYPEAAAVDLTAPPLETPAPAGEPVQAETAEPAAAPHEVTATAPGPVAGEAPSEPRVRKSRSRPADAPDGTPVPKPRTRRPRAAPDPAAPDPAAPGPAAPDPAAPRAPDAVRGDEL